MSEVVHADIFFFITATAVVVLSIGMAIALFYVIAILREVRAIAQKVRKASEELEADFEDFRTNMRAEGVRVRSLFGTFIGFLLRQLRPRRRTRVEEVDEVTVEDAGEEF